MREGFLKVMGHVLLVPVRLLLERELLCRNGIAIFVVYFAGRIIRTAIKYFIWRPYKAGLYGLGRRIYQGPLIGFEHCSKVFTAAYSEVFLTVIYFGRGLSMPFARVALPFLKNFSRVDLLGTNLFEVFSEHALRYTYFFFRSDLSLGDDLDKIYDVPYPIFSFVGVPMYIRSYKKGYTYGIYSFWQDRMARK